MDRFRGALLGLAVGDAVGTTVEFMAPGTFEPMRDMVGGGPFGLPAGAWTDDTSMALCLAESLSSGAASIPSTSSSATSLVPRGALVEHRRCFDIGNATRAGSSASNAPASRSPATPRRTRPATGR